jgi:glycosyltransferase involved in cell wall biosynthesis
MAGTQRVLYIDPAANVGGSVISLYQLIKGLNGGLYEPHVVLRASNPYASRFRELGVAVYIFGAGQPEAQGPARTLVAGARHGRLARWLKRGSWGERLVHLIGFYVRAYPRLQREARELERILRVVRPRLVHLNDVLCVNRAGILAARRARVPAICHLRAMTERNHYDRWLSRSLRGFICISHAVERHERSQGGRVGPSWVVYNGLDPAEFAPEGDSQAVRAELGLAADTQVVGCVGRLVPWKGQRVFLRALARVAVGHPRLRALIVGAPEPGGEGYARELAELARTLGLGARVTFLGFRADVLRLLAAMDVLVHASTDPEPFGRVLIEGMAAGKVVIGTDAGAVPEIIEDGVTGMLVPVGDEGAMAQAIARALDHPQEGAALGGAARQAVERRFTTAQYVQGVQRVYKEIL